MPQQPGHSLKLYYTIGEVAEMFSVNTSMIRYYEKEFDVLKPHKNKKGNRLFTQSDVDFLKRIIGLTKDEGHSLAEAREIIKTGISPKEEKPEEDVSKRLRRIKGLLKKMLEGLE